MSQPKAWVLLKDAATNSEAKAGSVVYDSWKHDYGCSSDDTRFTGIEHVSVTFDSTGDYPFFTVPKRDLRPLSDGEPA